MATTLDMKQPSVLSVKSLRWRSVLTGGIIVVGGSVIVNILNFLYSLVMARLLNPDGYATVTACLSIFVVATVPAGTLQLVTARYTAIWERSAPEQALLLVKAIARLALCGGAVVAIVLILLTPSISGYLRMAGATPLLIVSLLLMASFVGPVLRGRLQGQHRFGLYVASTIADAFVRLTVGTAAVILGWQAAGALGGVLVGTVIGMSLAWWGSREPPTARKAESIAWQPIARWAFPTLLVQIAMSALLFQDTLFAKHFFSASAAGAYAGVATTSRIMAYGAMALTTFLFPIIARHGTIGGKTRLVANLSLLFVTIGELVLLCAVKLAPQLVLTVVVGSQYASMSALLFPCACALASYALLTLVVNYLLAIGHRYLWIPILIAPLAEAVLMALFHASLHDFVIAEVVTQLAVLATTLILYITADARQPQRSRAMESKVDPLLGPVSE